MELAKRDLAHRREQKSQGVVGNFIDAVVGHLGDDDAALGGHGNIDVIHSDSKPRNDPAARHLPDHLRGDSSVGGKERIGVLGHSHDRFRLGLLGQMQLRADFGQNGARRVQVWKYGIGNGYL